MIKNSEVDNRLEELRRVFPEIFTEEKINWNLFRESIGHFIDDQDDETETYGMFWPGKQLSKKIAFSRSPKSLTLCKGEGVSEETSGNLFIKGDNLEVLKILSSSYSSRVKMIYIDPPYNTGKDFVYKDNYSETVSEYLGKTGQFDEEGKLSTNLKTGGRFHSNWLSMMYPRLILARRLLREDGVIFLSIGDEELVNLVKVCDEVFGEENRLGIITVESNKKGRSDDNYFATSHNYLLAYSKDTFESLGVPMPDYLLEDYPEKDDDGVPYRLQGLRKRGDGAKREDRPNMYYPFYVNPETEQVSLEKNGNYTEEVLPRLSDGTDGRWRWGKKKSQKQINELVGVLISRKNDQGEQVKEWDVSQKDSAFIDGKRKKVKPKTIWEGPEFSNETGTLELKKIFGQKVFDTPKPMGLIEYCMEQVCVSGDIVLDFFAGASTTAHSVLKFQKEKEIDLSFIMVQLEEQIDKKSNKVSYDFCEKESLSPNIAEISLERVRRALEDVDDRKLGVKVFRTCDSHVRILEKAPEDLFGSIDEKTINKDDLFWDIVLTEGFPLSSKLTEINVKNENKIIQVSSRWHEYSLYVCLDDYIDNTVIDEIDLGGDNLLICLDSAITDQVKLNLSNAGKIKAL